MPGMQESQPVHDLSMPPPRARLLVVEDDDVNVLLLQATLGQDHEVLVAGTGEQALVMCQRERPDLVLLDLVLPGIDGFEVCRELKSGESTRDIPVIFITARGDEQAEVRGLRAGAVDFISKPISPLVVRARIQLHLTIKRQADLLRELALVDGLTGVRNRRHFDEALALECARANRQGTPLSVGLVDVDLFKHYNDHYGHQAGDDCLRQVVAAMTASLQRPGDLCARYGGEEFAWILPDTDLRGALHVAARVRQRLREAGIEHAASNVERLLTVSVGVCTREADSQAVPELLLREADAQLYLAKSRGRNQACGTVLRAPRGGGTGVAGAYG